MSLLFFGLVFNGPIILMMLPALVAARFELRPASPCSLALIRQQGRQGEDRVARVPRGASGNQIVGRTIREFHDVRVRPFNDDGSLATKPNGKPLINRIDIVRTIDHENHAGGTTSQGETLSSSNTAVPASKRNIQSLLEVKTGQRFARTGKASISNREAVAALTKNQALGYPLLEANGGLLQPPKRQSHEKKSTQRLLEDLGGTLKLEPQKVVVIKLRPKEDEAQRQPQPGTPDTAAPDSDDEDLFQDLDIHDLSWV